MEGIAVVEYLRHYCVDPITACNFANALELYFIARVTRAIP